VGGGTAVFTANAYQAAGRPVVLTDVSSAMLGRAAARLGPAPVTLLQADLYDLPFEPNRFATVACFTMLHVLDRPWEALVALRGQLAPGGSLFASMLVDDRMVGRSYMRALRAAGEFGPPRSCDEFFQAARQTFGEQTKVDVERTGSVAWLRITAA
jgi:ubiquinone/menaquinone biosynthesis C-methylase UbiE